MSATPDADDVFARLDSDAQLDTGLAFARTIAGYFADAHAGRGPVSSPHASEALASRFAAAPPEDGRPLADVLAHFTRDVMSDCNRLAHPMAMGHQVSAPLPAAVWMESLTAALNQSAAVAEMSPTGTALETQLVRWLCAQAGFGAGAGGTFTSGGTEATFAALLAARSAAVPNVWRDGVGADPPLVVCGEHSHYSVSRAVGQMGLGLRNVIGVASADHRMDPRALAAALDDPLARGHKVMAVVATAGSTATGSFDDLEAIADICEARGLWLHVDACHGASALLSAAHRHRLRGIERARSVAWDAHKMLLVPLAAGVVLVRDERELQAAFSQSAPYLFHPPTGERVWDQGVRSFQCSRRLDAFKVWVALQRYGTRGMAALYDRLCETTRELHAMLHARADFETLHEPECNILCFRYVGGASGTAAPGEAAHDEAALDALNLEMRERWNRSGEGWITTTVLGGRRVLRVTLMNPRTSREHLARTVEGLARLGEGLVGGGVA